MIEKIAYSPKDAAEATNICKTNIFHAIARGDLKSRRFGRKRLILREDLLEWVKSMPEG